MKLPYRTVGYRFWETVHDPDFYQLFALGSDKVTSASYSWNGLTRRDGPLCLFQYTVSGYGQVDMDGQTLRINPGQAIMLDIPGQHRYYLPEGSPHWEFLFILFRPYGLEKHWQEAVTRLTRTPSLPKDSPALTVLQDMVRSGLHDQIADGYQASALVYRFMMELLRASSSRTQKRNSWPASIQLAIREIERSYQDLPSLDAIAAAAGLSKYHLVRQFKRHTGMTPIEYLSKIRVERSIALLRDSRLSIEEIARRVGYSGSSYYIKVFQRWTGFTPGEFRLGHDVVGLQQMKFD